MKKHHYLSVVLENLDQQLATFFCLFRMHHRLSVCACICQTRLSGAKYIYKIIKYVNIILFFLFCIKKKAKQNETNAIKLKYVILSKLIKEMTI